MTDRRSLSRNAGILYLMVVIAGMFSIAYVPGKLFDWKDAGKTLENIVSHETLFRASIAGGVVCYASFIFLIIVLYQLLRSVHETYAKLMAILALMSVPISFFNLIYKYQIVTVINEVGRDYFKDAAIPNIIMSYLNQYDNGILIVSFFWGIWLLPFGYLVYKSDFLPKVLGIILMLGCFAYLTNFFGNTLSPDYHKMPLGSYLSIIPAVGEIGACLWLLFIGGRRTDESK